MVVKLLINQQLTKHVAGQFGCMRAFLAFSLDPS